MYKLTKRREAKALAILEQAYDSLTKRGGFDAGLLERELRECWNIGYHELYDVLEDALKDERWRYVAVYYFESSRPYPTCEQKRALAKAYGVEHYGRNEEVKSSREQFWKQSGFKVV